MNRMTTESFVIDAPNIGEAVEDEKIDDALLYEELAAEDELNLWRNSLCHL